MCFFALQGGVVTLEVSLSILAFVNIIRMPLVILPNAIQQVHALHS